MPSPSNPFQNGSGDVQAEHCDNLPGIPEHRLRLGADYIILANRSAGVTVSMVSSFYYVGDEANQLAPIAGYQVVGLHTSYQRSPHLEFFAQITNLLDRRYSTWGILSDPTGVGAPGVNNRFQSPAAPFEVFAGARFRF